MNDLIVLLLGAVAALQVVIILGRKNMKASFSVVIHIDPADVSVGSSVPSGKVAAPYSGGLSISGGVAPYSVSLDPSSQVPPGLQVNADGTIEGTPTQAGDFPVMGTVTDARG